MIMSEIRGRDEVETTTVVVILIQAPTPSPIVTAQQIPEYDITSLLLAISSIAIHRSSAIAWSHARISPEPTSSSPPELTTTTDTLAEPVKIVTVETTAPASNETTLAVKAPTETAPAPVVADKPTSSPLKYDAKFNYFFLLLAMLFLMFGGLWYWVRRRAKKRKWKMTQAEEDQDENRSRIKSWCWDLPAMRGQPESVSRSSRSFCRRSNKGKGPALLNRSIAIKISTESWMASPEVAPWETQEGSSWSPFSGKKNRSMVPLTATKKLSPEEIARRHIPIPTPAMAVNTTCSGPITPAEYLDPDYVQPGQTPKRKRTQSVNPVGSRRDSRVQD